MPENHEPSEHHEKMAEILAGSIVTMALRAASEIVDLAARKAIVDLFDRKAEEKVLNPPKTAMEPVLVPKWLGNTLEWADNEITRLKNELAAAQERQCPILKHAAEVGLEIPPDRWPCCLSPCHPDP